MPFKAVKDVTEFDTLDECMRYCVGPGNPFRPPKDWAAILGVALSTLYSKGNPEGTVPFTLRDLMTISAFGVTLPLDFLALRCGCVVYPMLNADSGGDPLDVHVAESTISFGEFLKTVSNSRKTDSPGGRDIAPCEAGLIMARSIEMISKHAAIAQAMQKIIDDAKTSRALHEC